MNTAPPGPRFDISQIPFSRFGSWLALSPVVANASLAQDLHLVSHQQGMHAVLSLQPLSGDATRAHTQIQATPARLAWTGEAGSIEAAFSSTDTLRLRGSGLGLRIAAAAALTPFSGTYLYADPTDGAAVFTSYETGRRHRVTVLSGDASLEGDQALGAAPRSITLAPGGTWEIAIEQFQAARAPYAPREGFEEAAAAAGAQFAAFADRIAPWRGPGTPAAEQAAYVLWSATVEPAGFLGRPAVLMSKHWMDKVWSWDHCFNALALAEGDPQLAWHQFALPFDHQDPAGALPDSVAHAEVLYNYVKPPVHGWALARLLPAVRPALAPEQLHGAYRRLAAWTEYWLARCAPGSPLPHYHHGNDSGWDNATTFDQGRLVESADLSAFLVLQMRQLAALARDLGLDGAAAWARHADALQHAMIEHLWTGERFASRTVADGRLHTSDSLLDTMPIVLGEQLPEKVHRALASRIERHLTAHGLATEAAGSQHYDPDGYWRGPIWAPATVLIEDGLRRAGHLHLADEISRRFRALCERSGFAENFDAQTGAGQRDRAYTWTASAYLLLARQAAARARPAAGAPARRISTEETSPAAVPAERSMRG